MAEKGKPTEPDPIIFDGILDVTDSPWIIGRSPLNDAIDRAFDAMLADRMRLLDEEIMNGSGSLPLGIFGEGP